MPQPDSLGQDEIHISVTRPPADDAEIMVPRIPADSSPN